MRIDASLLLLVTPLMPAVVWTPVPPGVDPRPVAGAVPRPGCVDDDGPAVGDVPPPGPLAPRPPAADVPEFCVPPRPDPGSPCPTGIGAKSSLVIGSLYFLRRKRCSTSTLM